MQQSLQGLHLYQAFREMVSTKCLVVKLYQFAKIGQQMQSLKPRWYITFLIANCELRIANWYYSGFGIVKRMITAICALTLAIIHLFSGKLRFLNAKAHSRWLSFGSGVSVAYVFVHILPELSKAQLTLQSSLDMGLAFLEHHVYLVALLGLAVFYGLERFASKSRQRSQKIGKGDVTSSGVFWIHIASFAVYNALIGYLLVH
jgi:hypothetical protein